MKILVTDREGGQWEIEGEDGSSIGEAIIEANELPKDNRVQPFAICGLDCSCRTWHVLVDEEWFDRLEPKKDDEALERFGIKQWIDDGKSINEYVPPEKSWVSKRLANMADG